MSLYVRMYTLWNLKVYFASKFSSCSSYITLHHNIFSSLIKYAREYEKGDQNSSCEAIITFQKYSCYHLKNYCPYWTWTKKIIWHMYPIIVTLGILIQMQMQIKHFMLLSQFCLLLHIASQIRHRWRSDCYNYGGQLRLPFSTCDPYL